MTEKSPRPSSYPGRPDLHKKKNKKKGRKPLTSAGRLRQRNRRLALLVLGILSVLALLIVGAAALFSRNSASEEAVQTDASDTSSSDGPEEWMAQGAPYIDVQLLTPNEYSRPQLPLSEVKYIAIHYTANPGATAQENRDYFENLAQTHETKVSSHFVIGIEGEVIQCIPTSELAYATNERNIDTVAIECCHEDETGVFTDATYDSVVKLTAWLCVRFGLTADNVIRHYDVTGKDCPKYYVDNPDAWIQMKADIAAQIEADEAL